MSTKNENENYFDKQAGNKNYCKYITIAVFLLWYYRYWI